MVHALEREGKNMNKKAEEWKCYDDILNLPHPVSAGHPQMSMSERAAQFSPFAALTGYGAAIREEARLTEEMADLDEDSRETLDVRLAILCGHLKEGPDVTITYFEPDTRKHGGACRLVSGTVKKVDFYRHSLIMEDGTVIPMEHIMEMDGEVFEERAE